MFSDFFWKNIHNPLLDLNWKAIIFWSDRKGIMDQCRHRKSSWTCPRCWSVIHSSLRCTFWRVAHDVFLKTVVQPSLQNGWVKKVLKVSKKGTEASSSNFDCQDVCDFWRFVLFRGRHVLGYHCYHFPLEPVRYGGALTFPLSVLIDVMKNIGNLLVNYRRFHGPSTKDFARKCLWNFRSHSLMLSDCGFFASKTSEKERNYKVSRLEAD